MMKGPAPTGSCANAFSPILLNAVSEAIQFGIESNIWLMNAPSGTVRLTWMGVGSITLMTPGAGADVLTMALVRASGHAPAQVQVDSPSPVQCHLTAAPRPVAESSRLTLRS